MACRVLVLFWRGRPGPRPLRLCVANRPMAKPVPEVTDFEVGPLLEQEVNPLDIAVHDPMRVQVRGSTSVSPTVLTVCLLLGYRRAGTQNDSLGESFPTVRSACPLHVYTRNQRF